MGKRFTIPGDRKPGEVVKDLDRLFFRAVLVRDGGVCQKCGAAERVIEKVSKKGKPFKRRVALNPHHIFSRAYPGTKWDPANGVLLCVTCHLRWASVKFEEFRDWIIERMGEGAYTRLKYQAYNGTTPDKFAMKMYLEQVLARYEEVPA
jgi:hypothetical protein